MDSHRIRNLVPPMYAALVVGAFFISATVGVIVVIVGALLSAMMWSALSGSGSASGRRDRSARAARRSGRR